MKKSIAVLSLTIAVPSASQPAAATPAPTPAPPHRQARPLLQLPQHPQAPPPQLKPPRQKPRPPRAPSAPPALCPAKQAKHLRRARNSNQQATSALYRASKESLNEFKEDSSVKKAQTSDGTVYYNNEVAAFESKDGAIVIIQNTGAWSSFDSNGGTIVVDEDGSWIKTNPKDNLYTVVNADGTASVLNTKTFEQATDVSTIETPKAPGRIDGFSGTAKTPVKPTKIGDLSEVAGAK